MKNIAIVESVGLTRLAAMELRAAGKDTICAQVPMGGDADAILKDMDNATFAMGFKFNYVVPREEQAALAVKYPKHKFFNSGLDFLLGTDILIP
jgi:sulfopyruvate decarboxylase TPP-binding subunit